jgi:ABC-type Mn2+/Zn2+ transport system permease subunit
MIYDALIAPFTEFEFMRRALAAVIALALGGAPIGVFLMLRRMSLVGDAMAHAILPGAAVGFLVSGLNLFAMTFGGLIAGFLVALLAGLVSRVTEIKEDASLATFYLVSLALGVTIVSMRGTNIDLLHVLFGNILAMDDQTLLVIAFNATITLLALAVIYRPLVIECVDPLYLRTVSRAGAPSHLAFLALVVINLVNGFHALGTLLAVGLMVLPAGIARFWSRDVTGMIGIAVLSASVSGYLGLVLSFQTKVPSGPAISLAPPSGPSTSPLLPAPITQPPVAAIPAPSLPAPALPAQGVLALSARYGKDLPAINSGLVWRVFSDRPDETGAFKLIREDRTPSPNIPLPPGSYVVHVSLGLVSAVRPVTLKADTDREAFVLPAGGLRIEGRVGTSKIPPNQISFSIFKGSQFDGSDRQALVPNVNGADIVLLPEGTYYITSNYGDANSVVRSDIRVQAGKLTDLTISHRAAVITLKLVGDKGGEALANTAWSVITPAGDVIKESIGAFPRVVLSEGEYRAIAKNEGKVFERPFNVVNGVDGEVEVVAR